MEDRRHQAVLKRPDEPDKDPQPDGEEPDEAPETPTDEPPPVPVKDPPPGGTPRGPYVAAAGEDLRP